MAPFSVCSSGWPSWCDVVFLFQLLHLVLARVPLPLFFQLFHSFPSSLSLFSLSPTWALLPSLTIWASPPQKVSVLLLFIVHKPTGLYEVEFQHCFLLKRAYMSMSLLVCLRYVCVRELFASLCQ